MNQPAWLANWLERHQSGLSFWLHMVGIPLTILSLPLAGWQLWQSQSDPGQWALWWRPLALLVGGYFLQWLGHLHEGNDMGEIILVKRWLGRPYVAVAPRYRRGEANPRGAEQLTTASSHRSDGG